MRWGILWGQKNRRWIIKAVDRRTRRTVAWVVGDRHAQTFERLYDQVIPNPIIY